MALTKPQAAAVITLLDYLSETTPLGRNWPPRHADAHQALVLLAVTAGIDGHDADERLAKAWRDRLNVEAEIADLKRQIADLAPYAEAGKQAATEAAKREYYQGSCDDCSCCTTAQCSENRCPTNLIGESTCPCTCY